MIQLPKQLITQYKAFLVHKKIPLNLHQYFLKWLRYYLDFCQKYQFQINDQTTMDHFIKKLQDKRQTPQRREQASHAVLLFLELLSSQKGLLIALSSEREKSAEEREWKAQINELSNQINLRHYSKSTLQTYTNWVIKFQRFLQNKSPGLLQADDVKKYLTDLATRQKVSASTQNQAFNALLFFYRHVLKRDFGDHKDVPRAKRKPYIPVVLSREEVDNIIQKLVYPYDLVVKLLYGCGLRLFECLNLRVQCFNFDTGMLTVHDGKGKKDRTVPLPKTIYPELKEHLRRVGNLLERDEKEGFAGVFMMNAIEKKYPNSAKELPWQFYFPAKQLTYVPDKKEYRRYHLHETHVQKAIKQAVRKARIGKRVTSYTFRHSFATHLLQANYDIRTIQQLLGHSDVKTTMIYTHVAPSQTTKDAQSPLDFS